MKSKRISYYKIPEDNMKEIKRLKTGVAYYGNRMLSHAMADMKDIARSDMDIVVHMFTHNDMERSLDVVRDIFKATEAEGLEVWVDNWGIGGAPGDKGHFLAYHPEAHSYYGDGQMHPYQICLNAPSYRQFVKDWVDKVAEIGGKTIFWDEPNIPNPNVPGTDDYFTCCNCPTCQKLFEERFNKKMPLVMDADVSKFRNDVMIDYHNFISEYANSLGLKNIICFMPYQLAGMTNQTEKEKLLNFDIDAICAMPYIDNIGTDPYWYGRRDVESPYQYNYESTKLCLAKAEKYGKDHNIWIQGYNAAIGREEEIIEATEGVYDAGARTILSWSYRAAESHNYRSPNVERSWNCTLEGFRRIKSMERDRILAENRKKYMK